MIRHMWRSAELKIRTKDGRERLPALGSSPHLSAPSSLAHGKYLSWSRRPHLATPGARRHGIPKGYDRHFSGGMLRDRTERGRPASWEAGGFSCAQPTLVQVSQPEHV